MKIWHRLDLRMAMAVLLGLVVSGAALVSWQAHEARTAADAQWQAQSLGLARYVVQRHAAHLESAVLARRSDALTDIGMYISMIHPALEAYLLAPDGQVVAHTLPLPGPERKVISLAPVKPLMQEGAPRLPVYGDDPRQTQGRNLVSLAPVGAAGWLYLVLRGEQATRIIEGEAAESRQAAWLGVVFAAMLLGGAMTWTLQHQVTRRLRRLAAELAAFRQVAAGRTAQARGDEIDQLCHDARDLQERVQQQFRQLEDSDRQRRELITNISHDLHTPLANIRGWLDTLLISGERLSPQERERHLRTTARHCASLSRRVGELFELANLDSARTVAHPEPFCMAELVSDVIQAHQLGAEQRGIELRMAGDADLRASVVADIGLIERVLNNLVDNALRHTSGGGRVELTVSAEAEQVRVRVADNGRGIAAADLPHVFERYWTTRSIESDPGGTNDGAVAYRPGSSAGLGLAIARRIVELHGGTIGVQSRERMGCEFTFSIPVPSMPA